MLNAGQTIPLSESARQAGMLFGRTPATGRI
jgi:hypothetical protein